MRVNHRCFDMFVPQEFLDLTDVDPIHQKVRGKAVPQGVNRRWFGNLRPYDRLMHGFLNCLFTHIKTPDIAVDSVYG